MVMRLANAEVLPFEFTALAATVARYVDELEKLADTMRKETAEQNRQLERGVFEAAWAPPDETGSPPADDPVPHLNFAPLRNGRPISRPPPRAMTRPHGARCSPRPGHPGEAILLQASER